MSLTSMIDNLNSPLAQWLNQTFDRLLIQQMVKQLNDNMFQSILSPILPAHDEYTLAGNAFDYLFRWQLEPLTKTTAQNGAAYLVLNGWEKAIDVLKTTIDLGTQTTSLTERAAYSVVLAWFEIVFRSNARSVAAPLREIQTCIDPVATVEYLRQQVNPILVEDLVILVSHAPDVWQFVGDQKYFLNPIFDGSFNVGGADADWIVDHTLYECKVTIKKRPFSRRTLLQTIGYALLDYNNRYAISKIGWYYPRQKFRYALAIDDLFDRLNVTKSLPELRRNMQSLLA